MELAEHQPCNRRCENREAVNECWPPFKARTTRFRQPTGPHHDAVTSIRRAFEELPVLKPRLKIPYSDHLDKRVHLD